MLETLRFSDCLVWDELNGVWLTCRFKTEMRVQVSPAEEGCKVRPARIPAYSCIPTTSPNFLWYQSDCLA